MPIFHTYASLCASFFFEPPGSSASRPRTSLKFDHNAKDSPNVLLIIHESLSGEYSLTHDSAVQAMPFFQEMFQSNRTDFFVFENSRSVSGDTADCVTAITSGCLPLDHPEGLDVALSDNLATQAQMRGFDTISFSSRKLVSIDVIDTMI
ncbi:hypothetical protein ACHAXS_002557 [Conticribra weissflogii]